MRMICRCTQPIEFEPEMLGSDFTCPSCHRINVLIDAPQVAIPLPEKSRPQPKYTPKQKAHTKPLFSSREIILHKIREQSCYKALRGVIQVACIGLSLPGFFSILAGMVGLGMLAIADNAGSIQSKEIWVPVATIALALIWLVLCLAMYQALVMLIDAVDTLIYDQEQKMIPPQN